MSDLTHVENPPTIDPVASSRWEKWPHRQSPWLHEEIARRMEDRLQWIRFQPKFWIHWAPLTGGIDAHKLLVSRYPDSSCQVIETNAKRELLAKDVLQKPWWKRWLTPNTFKLNKPSGQGADLLWANMTLHTSDQPQVLLKKWHELLAVDGFLMFSCLGPDTLRELNDLYLSLGWPPASHAFTDMHDWGDMLVQAGFAEPVMDMERITLTYETPERLLTDLRGIGRNLHINRFAKLRGRGWLKLLHQSLWSLAKPEKDGRISVTVEVIYGHAFKPLPRLKVETKTTVALDDMKKILGQPSRMQGSNNS